MVELSRVCARWSSAGVTPGTLTSWPDAAATVAVVGGAVAGGAVGGTVGAVAATTVGAVLGGTVVLPLVVEDAGAEVAVGAVVDFTRTFAPVCEAELPHAAVTSTNAAAAIERDFVMCIMGGQRTPWGGRRLLHQCGSEPGRDHVQPEREVFAGPGGCEFGDIGLNQWIAAPIVLHRCELATRCRRGDVAQLAAY